MVPKSTDSKGRVTLGPDFANQHVLIERVDENEIRIVLAKIIPKREAWLHENKDAMAAVQRGMADAKDGRFVEGPSLGDEEDED